jgi:GDP-D-mannose dehydratase
MNYEDYVVSSPEFFRPLDSVNLEGNPHKLSMLGWQAQVGFEQLVQDMVQSDLILLQTDQYS